MRTAIATRRYNQIGRTLADELARRVGRGKGLRGVLVTTGRCSGRFVVWGAHWDRESSLVTFAYPAAGPVPIGIHCTDPTHTFFHTLDCYQNPQYPPGDASRPAAGRMYARHALADLLLQAAGSPEGKAGRGGRLRRLTGAAARNGNGRPRGSSLTHPLGQVSR
ncbi:MAG: hypothetical protein ACHRXM_09335 [Isosphaerales bacterium]